MSTQDTGLGETDLIFSLLAFGLALVIVFDSLFPCHWNEINYFVTISFSFDLTDFTIKVVLFLVAFVVVIAFFKPQKIL